MKQNIIVLGLIASAGLTFFQVPKANAWNSGPSVRTSIEESQTVGYTAKDEDGDDEKVETGKKGQDR
ncbi:MAG: hypothetical protein QNJ68_11965 [Microcoleaceae cyanobacterium MO_207.B10]|nr:hypothetical protein [Microcoleaceae cyanobacterium MO_207.B10]